MRDSEQKNGCALQREALIHKDSPASLNQPLSRLRSPLSPESLPLTDSRPVIGITESNESKCASVHAPSPNETDVVIVAELVPSFVAPLKLKSTGYLAKTNSFDEVDRLPDGNSEWPSSSAIQNSLSYDCEESCLISTAGIDSEFGRVHCPSAWTKAMSDNDSNIENEASGKKITLTRTYRGEQSSYTRNNEHFSTGNKARDELLSRARALLQAHEGSSELNPRVVSHCARAQQPHDHSEDGLSPLGGHWSTNSHSSPTEPLNDAMSNLPLIHDKAVAKLRVRIVVLLCVLCFSLSNLFT
jgi:hypothetical protein